MDNNQQIVDLEVALLSISLKNDQINKLKSTLKTSQKKASIKATDLQFKLDQYVKKNTQLERKITKNQQNLSKIKQQHEEQLKKLHLQIRKQNETINELYAQQRRKQRQFKAVLFEEKLKNEKQKQNSQKLSDQLEYIHKYFDPKKILSIFEKKSLEQVPKYTQLYQKNLQNMEQIKHLNLQTEKLKSQTILSIEETFKKITSYEDVMQILSNKNNELQESIRIKQQQLASHSQQIIQKKQLLQLTKQQANLQLQNLNNEIHTLRSYVNQYQTKQEQKSINQNQQNYHSIIQQLQKIIEKNQNDLILIQNNYQQKINQLNLKYQNLHNIFETYKIQAQNQKQDIEGTFNHLKNIINQKDQLILLLNNSIKQQQQFFEQKQKQYQGFISQLSEQLKFRRQKQSEYYQNQNLYRQQLSSYYDQIQYLKTQLQNYSQKQVTVDQFHPVDDFDTHSFRQTLQRTKSGYASFVSQAEHNNLLNEFKNSNQFAQDDKFSKIDIGNYQKQPNWSELYYGLLSKHNRFLAKVRERLQSIKNR